MNILNAVTVRNLRKNRVRTLVTIIGIILSVSMFTAVTTSIVSFQSYLVNVVKSSTGSWEGMAEGVSGENVQKLKSNDDIKSFATLQNVGFAKVDTNNEYMPYIYIGGISKNFTDFVPLNITEGKAPKNSNEIILPNRLASNGGIKHKIGDKITLDVGQRFLKGEELYQNTGLLEDEKLENLRTVSYTVVGFYARPGFESYESPAYSALTVADNSTDNYMVFVCAKNMKNIHSVMKTVPSASTDFNTDLLRFNGASGEAVYNKVLYGFAAILIVIIMAGSISLIYNAFSISVSERTKQFGLLKSIGATKRQMLRSVLYEAFVLCLFGIPLGVLSGIGGIGITIHFIKDLFRSLVATATEVTLSLTISLPAILIAVAIGLLTVFISAYIPAKRAVRKPAIESIRQSADIKIKAKKVKTSRLTYKLFGFEGMIAKKNFKRNRKKYRSTVISLFMSILLFMTAGTFSAYLNTSANNIMGTCDFDVQYVCYNANSTPAKNYENSIKIYDKLKNIDGVEKSNMIIMGTTFQGAIIKSKLATDDYVEMEMNNSGEKNGNVNLYPNYLFIDDNIYEEYLQENGYDKSIYLNKKNPVALCSNDVTAYNSEAKKYRSYSVLKDDNQTLTALCKKKYDGYYCDINDGGEEGLIYKSENGKKSFVSADDNDLVDKKIQVGEFIKDAPFGTGTMIGKKFCLIYPRSAMNTVFSGADVLFEFEIAQLFKAPNHKKVTDAMSNLLAAKGFGTDNLYDITENLDASKAIMMVVNVFTYGFIILISLICVANVFNTISTNISLRRREFAMLKSVGMPNKGFNKMMNYECLLYGLKSLVYGLPFSLFVSLLIYNSLLNGIDMPFIFPWQNIIIVTVSVFLVVFITMLYSMRKIKKDNPIDALKNENI